MRAHNSTLAASETDDNLDIQSRIKQYVCQRNINLSRGQYIDQDMQIVIQQTFILEQCTELVLLENKITWEGARILATGLCNSKALQKLDLGCNDIGDKGVQYIVQILLNDNETLTKLHLQSNGISAKGAQHLAEMLKTSRTLLHLGLDSNEIGDQGVRMLARSLDANSGRIREHSVSQTSRNSGTRLAALYLNQNKITDVGIQSVAHMLRTNQTLTNLSLSENQITDSGMEDLLDALIHYNTSIINLDLFSNKQITGLSLDGFLELFQQNRKFQSYKLQDCGFNEVDKDELRAAAAKIAGFRLVLGSRASHEKSSQANHNDRRVITNTFTGYRLREESSPRNKIYPPSNRRRDDIQPEKLPSKFEGWCSARRKGSSREDYTQSSSRSHNNDIEQRGQLQTQVQTPFQSSSSSLCGALHANNNQSTYKIDSDFSTGSSNVSPPLLAVSQQSNKLRPTPKANPSLVELFKSEAMENDEIVEYIHKNMDTLNEFYIQNVVLSYLYACIVDGNPKKKIQETFAQRRVLVLNSIIDGIPEGETEIIYAIEIFITELKHPSKMALLFFNTTFNQGCVSRDTFLTWYNRPDQSESSDHRKIKMATEEFFTSLIYSRAERSKHKAC